MSNLLNIQPRESLQMGKMLVSNPVEGKAQLSHCHLHGLLQSPPWGDFLRETGLVRAASQRVPTRSCGSPCHF